MTAEPHRRWIALTWLMLAVTVVLIAAAIYLGMQWQKADREQNEWLDQMCTLHGGAYCEHQVPPAGVTTAR